MSATAAASTASRFRRTASTNRSGWWFLRWGASISRNADPRRAVVALVTLATFTDIVAYSVAVPVLPDLSRRLGAGPATIGFLFASFGVTLVAVSIPMGAVSDRIGRKAPLVSGLAALAAATVLFAFAGSLPWLFAARLVQGAADAVTWVVGFALIADLFGDEERGRVTGIIMSGTSFAVMLGPSLGGWLYEIGGARLPYLAVAALAAAVGAAFAVMRLPPARAPHETVSMAAVMRTPAVVACALAVVAASSTISMLEPVLALHVHGFGVGPGRVGLLFGVGAVVSTLLHPAIGRLSDRWGARRLTLSGLGALAIAVALLALISNYRSAVVFFALGAASGALVITPSLAYMGEATSQAGLGSFGVAYGIYNMAWGAGLLAGPALGGALYERFGFPPLVLGWSPALLAVAAILANATRSRPDAAGQFI